MRQHSSPCTGAKCKATLEVLRGDADGVSRDATRVLELSREYGLGEFSDGMYFGWARAHRSDTSDNEIDVAELRNFERPSQHISREEGRLGFHSIRDCLPRSKLKGKT